MKPLEKMTKEELLDWIVWANNEVMEYKVLLDDLNSVLYTKYSNKRKDKVKKVKI